MKTTAKLSTTGIVLRAILLLIFLMVGAVHSMAQAKLYQSGIEKKDMRYSGYELSFGAKSYSLKSEMEKLNGITIQQMGGSVGVVIGNQFGKLRATTGYFYSVAPITVNRIRVGVSGNFYLLSLGRKKFHTIEPYLVGSLKVHQSKFFGFYLSEDGPVNYSVTREPVLGMVRTFEASGGIGMEMQLVSNASQFIHLFSEVTMGTALLNGGSNLQFMTTQMARPVQVAIGLSFGIVKK